MFKSVRDAIYRVHPNTPAVLKWRQKPENYAKTREWNRNYITRKKLKLLNILGTQCARCGNGDIRVLQIDHINGNGLSNRRRFNTNICSERSQVPMILYYVKHPEEAKQELQTLCANCNWIKRAERGETKPRVF